MPSAFRISSRRLGTLGAAIVVAVSLTGPPSTGAGAAPVGDSTEAGSEHIELVAEQYNLARLNVDRANAGLERTDSRIEAGQSRIRLVRSRLRERASALYRGSGSGHQFTIGTVNHIADINRRGTYLDAAERPDRELLTSLTSELAHLDVERANQRDQRTKLQSTLVAAVQARKKLQAMAAAERARNVAPPAGDGAGPIASSPHPAGGTGSVSGAPSTPPPTTVTTRPAGAPPTPPPAPSPVPTGAEPAVSPGAAAAIAFARAQLGKPYSFATSGPGTFDCSGLTMAAWAAGGVRMAHYSGSQAASFPKVTWDQLKPGDIVVYYPDLHHVGLYIGGGQMIHAPQTGDVVKIAPAGRTTFMFGVRPR